jgi:hypothetical protein
VRGGSRRRTADRPGAIIGKKESENFTMAANGQSNVAVTPDLLLPDLLQAHPEARPVFDRYGLRGCGGPLGPHESIHFFAQAHGVDESRLLQELEQAIAAPGTESGKTADGATFPSLADTIYRRYFLGGILVALTAGATWGAWLLWTISVHGSFQSISVSSVNAHGEAQVFGWMSLFIMGFAYQAFPRLWHTDLPAPRLAAWAFLFMVAGLVVRTVAIASGALWPLAPAAALLGGAFQLAAVAIFTGQIVLTFLRSEAKVEPYVGFVLAALGWFAVSSLVSVWHTWNTMTVQTVDDLVWYIATYQSPLRDLQFHGLALFMILGVSQRMLPAFYQVPGTQARRGWLALAILVAAVLGEVALFLLSRWTGNRSFQAFLPLSWAMLATGCAVIVLPWRLWRPFSASDRSAKFVRAAYAWLGVSLAMLFLSPVYLYAYRFLGPPRLIPFSHAYAGAIRHAITVGFISLMIMGFAAKVVATLNGVDPRRLSNLWGPFLLVSVGCLLRVVMQPLTDWSSGIARLLGISGTLEVAGLAWWGLGVAGIIISGMRPLGASLPATGPPPERIEGHHRVADVLEWFPETESVFLKWGFTAIKAPLLRNTLARQVSLAQAASLRGVALDELVAALNAVIAARRKADAACPSDLPLVQIGA